MTTDPFRLDLTRTFPATPEQLWQRWTTASGLATWWWTHFPDTTYDIDARPGGHWRTATASIGIAVGGTFETVEAPRRVTFSWVWTDGGGEGPVEQVEVTFTAVAEGTRIDIVHTGPGGAEQAESYRQGWIDVLDSLADALDASAAASGHAKAR